MIGVTGATGQLGGHVLRFLLDRVSPSQLVAVVRDTSKAAALSEQRVQVRSGDYDAPETLTEAFAGVKRLLLIASNSTDRRTPQHRAVIEAATEAGVELIAYTSLLYADSSPMILAQMHRETEALLKTADIDYVILRNGWYVENFYPRIRGGLAEGSFKGCAADGRISCATRADYAAGAGAVLLSGDLTSGTVYELASEQSFTLAEMAREVARQTGRSFAYDDLSGDEYRAVLESGGMTPAVADLLANCDEGAAQGFLQAGAPQLERLTDGPCTSLEQAVAQAVGS